MKEKFGGQCRSVVDYRALSGRREARNPLKNKRDPGSSISRKAQAQLVMVGDQQQLPTSGPLSRCRGEGTLAAGKEWDVLLVMLPKDLAFGVSL